MWWQLAESLDSELQHAGYLEAGVGPFSAWALQRTLADMVGACLTNLCFVSLRGLPSRAQVDLEIS